VKSISVFIFRRKGGEAHTHLGQLKKLISLPVFFSKYKTVVRVQKPSNPLDVYYSLMSPLVFPNLHTYFKVYTGDKLHWDPVKIPYVAIVFISKADEF
jgi:hypothetical protein